MTILGDNLGVWAGTNGFRLMPADPLAEAPATATVTSAAGGHLTSVAYTWEHPADGPQDGFLLVGAGEQEGEAVALWGDSWHQKPAARSLQGKLGPDGTVTLEAEYGGGWAWRIVLVCGDDLLMRMDNILPPEHATPEMPDYPAMVMRLNRA